MPDDVEASKASIWLHQFKLMEGVDAPSFQMLANFDQFGNARSLIQQIGRVIRKKGNTDSVAYVMDNSNGHWLDQWNRYLQFDEDADKNSGHAFFDSAAFTQDMIMKQPGSAYFLGNFRSALDFEKVKIEKDVLLPLSCRVMESSKSVDLDKIELGLMNELGKSDRVSKSYSSGKDFIFVMHAGAKQSPHLPNHIFLETDLQIAIAIKKGNRVYVYDKRGIIQRSLVEDYYATEVDEGCLRKLFSKSKSTIVTEVALKNTLLGRNTIRRKQISARQVGETAVALDDHSQFCVSTSGFSFEENPLNDDEEEHIRRSVSFSAGSIQQESCYSSTFDRYKMWIDHIDMILGSRVHSPDMFKRYSNSVKAPAGPKISNVLVDLAEVENLFSYIDGVQPMFDDVCADVSDKGEFSIEISGKKYDCEIGLSSSGGRFVFSSPSLDDDFKKIEEGRYQTLSRMLNETQSFSILFSNSKLVYSHGRFLEPSIQIGTSFDASQFKVLDLLEPFQCLETIVSEKGNACTPSRTNWQSGSLFRLISDLGAGSPMVSEFGSRADVDFLICDDMGTEIADFVICDKERVIFVHGKASRIGAQVSASKLADVCSQATKNISYLSPFNRQFPSKLNKWNGPWTANGVSGSVNSRILLNRPRAAGPTEIWNQISERIRKPGTKKEVWIMLGNLLSKREFEMQLRSNGSYRVALQVSLQLMACYQAVYQMGGRLKVFCGR